MGEHSFPDGTTRLTGAETGEQNFTAVIFPYDKNRRTVVIKMKYESSKDLENLLYITRHIRDKFPEQEIVLKMPYIPNARMDRVYSKDQVFTLKYFADFINWLNFDSVEVYDPHSNVSEALFNHIKVTMPSREMIDHICSKNGVSVLYFPDAGAQKRYKYLLGKGAPGVLSHIECVCGEKIRNFSTGAIEGLEIKGDDAVMGKIMGGNVLMIDDIISYGGTMAYSADKLKEMCANKIFIYASHTENSILDPEKGTLLKRLEDGTVNRIFTTNSIFTGDHPKIEVDGYIF